MIFTLFFFPNIAPYEVSRGEPTFFKRKMLSFQIIFPQPFFTFLEFHPILPPTSPTMSSPIKKQMFKNTKNYEGANLQMFQNLDQ